MVVCSATRQAFGLGDLFATIWWWVPKYKDVSGSDRPPSTGRCIASASA